MEQKNNIFVIMPAYNAMHTLEKVHASIPLDLIDNLLLTDDGSKDKTVELARKLKIPTIVHPKNRGYGVNQKTCYDYALQHGATHVIMLHPDGQYEGRDLRLFVDALNKHKADLILGSRFLENHHQTPRYKAISIRFLTILFNIFLGTQLTEVSTGYRGFTRKFLETVPYHNNGAGYIFDPQIIIQAKYFGFSIAEVPVTKDYMKEASSPTFSQSVVHGLENLLLLTQYVLQIWGIKKVKFLTPS